MGDTNPPIESVLMALLALVRVLTPTSNITEEVTQIIESIKPVETQAQKDAAASLTAIERLHQKRLDEYDRKHPAFKIGDWNRQIYVCSGCKKTGHTMANTRRPCLIRK